MNARIRLGKTEYRIDLTRPMSLAIENRTQTVCVGQLTRDALDAHRVVPAGLLPAMLISVSPELLSDAVGDLIITRTIIERAWKAARPVEPRALVVRTLPNDIQKRRHDYTSETPAYFSADAIERLIERRIEHLVIDLPSIDRAGEESFPANRVFYGLPADTRDLMQAKRAQCTVTGLAFVPDTATDGLFLLELQAPALVGHAVPSRPLLYTPLPP